jgi:hypothetical protein
MRAIEDGRRAQIPGLGKRDLRDEYSGSGLAQGR